MQCLLYNYELSWKAPTTSTTSSTAVCLAFVEGIYFFYYYTKEVYTFKLYNQYNSN